MSDAATHDHTLPCAKCRGDIKQGDPIRVYATAGGDAGEGLTYWSHKTCPPRSQEPIHSRPETEAEHG